MSWPPPPQQVAGAWYRRLVQAMFAPAAIRPDGSGVGMNHTEAILENTEAQRDLARAVRQLVAALDRFRVGGDDGEGV